MSRRPVWLGTSWKMNKTIGEALAYVDRLVQSPVPAGVQAFLLPPHTALAAVRRRLPAGCPVLLGAQNAHWAPEGAGTGEVSMRMVQDAGADLVELGHSERREHFGDSDEVVERKVRAALDAGLVPLVCVGEPVGVRHAGGAEDFVLGQLRTALSRATPEEVSGVLVAYEPVWAIGSRGRAASPEEVAPVMAALTEELGRLSGGGGCRALLYGGSVDSDNAGLLLAAPHTDGLFVGRSAWSAEGLLQLLAIAGKSASSARNSR